MCARIIFREFSGVGRYCVFKDYKFSRFFRVFIPILRISTREISIHENLCTRKVISLRYCPMYFNLGSKMFYLALETYFYQNPSLWNISVTQCFGHKMFRNFWKLMYFTIINFRVFFACLSQISRISTLEINIHTNLCTRKLIPVKYCPMHFDSGRKMFYLTLDIQKS